MSSPFHYSGVGFEMGFVMPGWELIAPIPFPNIELIFGKEYEWSGVGKWRQLGINLTPLAVGIIGLAQGVMDDTYGGIILGALGMTVLTYSWAF